MLNITPTPFKWSELNGKDLKIHVGKSDGIVVVVGRDTTTNKLYILFSGKDE